MFKLTPGGVLTPLTALVSFPLQPHGLLLQASDGDLYGITGVEVFKLTLAGTRTTLAGAADTSCSLPLLRRLWSKGPTGTSTILRGGC